MEDRGGRTGAADDQGAPTTVRADARLDRPRPTVTRPVADAAMAAADPAGALERGAARAAGRRYSGMSPAERARHRRASLLAAALDLFAGRGYASTSIEQICQVAAVGLKGFYDEFGTKERLLVELYEELYDRVCFEFYTDVVRIEPGDDSTHQLLSAWVRATVRDPKVAKVMFVESVGASVGSEAFRQATRRKMAEQVVLGYGRGLFGPPVVDPLPPSIALALTGGLLELVRDWILAEPAPTVDELTERVVQYCRVVFAGVRAEL